jgi:hypothetical protein
VGWRTFEKQSNLIIMATRGGKRPGAGRKRGIPNKMTVRTREALWEYIDSKTTTAVDANPFRRLVHRMLHTDNEQLEVTCARILADRLMPSLQATQVTGHLEESVTVVIRGTLDGNNHRVSIPRLETDANGAAQGHEAL